MKTKKSIIAIMLLLCFSLLSGVYAQSLTIASQTVNNGSVNISPYDSAGQSFTTGTQATSVTTISLLLSDLGYPTATGSIYLILYSNSVGGTTLETSNSLDVATISSTATYCDFTFSGNAVLSPSTIYYFAVWGSAANSALMWSDDNGVNTFGTGMQTFILVAGTWYSQAEAFCFIVYGNAATAPTPTPYQASTPTPYQPTPTPYNGNPTPTPTPYYYSPTPTPQITYILGYGFSSRDLAIIIVATAFIMAAAIYVSVELNKTYGKSGKSRKHR